MLFAQLGGLTTSVNTTGLNIRMPKLMEPQKNVKRQELTHLQIYTAIPAVREVVVVVAKIFKCLNIRCLTCILVSMSVFNINVSVTTICPCMPLVDNSVR